MTLRGDLKKSNIPIHIVTDKKVLSFIPNDAIGEFVGGESSSTSESDYTEHGRSHSQYTGSQGNMAFRKRASLLNLDEEQMILKYCELKAKYDNLLESSSQKIYELTTAKDVVMETVKVVESSKEDKELIAKYEVVMQEKDKVIYGLWNFICE